jgi:hypothetical protein
LIIYKNIRGSRGRNMNKEKEIKKENKEIGRNKK